MAGYPKGLLPAPEGGTLIERTLRITRAALPDAQIVLVGKAAAYRRLDLPVIADAPTGIGPLGGIAPLLARGRATNAPAVFVLGCDLPFLSYDLLVRLARHAPDAAAVAPQIGGRWQALFARLTPATALPVATAMLTDSEHALQGLFRRLAGHATPLPIHHDDQHFLRDWDRPGDICF